MAERMTNDPMSDLWDDLKSVLHERLLDLFFEERYDSAYGDTFKFTLIVTTGEDHPGEE